MRTMSMIPSMSAAFSELDGEGLKNEKSDKAASAIQKLQALYDDVCTRNKELEAQLAQHNEVLTIAQKEKDMLYLHLQQKDETIAALKRSQQENTTKDASVIELERTIHEQIQHRLELEHQIEELQTELAACKTSLDKVKTIAVEKLTNHEAKERMIVDFSVKIEDLDKHIGDLLFQIDELKVSAIRNEQVREEMAHKLAFITEQNETLRDTEGTLREENKMLQRKIMDLLSANKEVTSNYTALKKLYDHQMSENGDLQKDLIEARDAAQAALRSKKQTQAEILAVTKQKTDMTEKMKTLENLLSRKEKDISDLLAKVNDTINDYESKLESKEEQIWAMTVKMNEEAQKLKAQVETATAAAAQAQAAAATPAAVIIDADVIGDVERKWQQKEKLLVAELERLKQQTFAKEDEITHLKKEIEKLAAKQYEPRMEYLKRIETEVEQKLEEYVIADESVETGFLCPRCIQPFNNPVSLHPCGCTYCKDCLELMKEENYNQLKCQECQTIAESSYVNERLDMVKERFMAKRQMQAGFSEWIKSLQKGKRQ